MFWRSSQSLAIACLSTLQGPTPHETPDCCNHISRKNAWYGCFHLGLHPIDISIWTWYSKGQFRTSWVQTYAGYSDVVFDLQGSSPHAHPDECCAAECRVLLTTPKLTFALVYEIDGFCRMVNDITADVGLPHRHGSESTTYQHGNPLFVTHESGAFEETAVAAQNQGPPVLETSSETTQDHAALENASLRNASLTSEAAQTFNSIHTLPARATLGPMEDFQGPNMHMHGSNRNNITSGVSPRESPGRSFGGDMQSNLSPGGLLPPHGAQPDRDASLGPSAAFQAEQQLAAGSQPSATTTGIADLYRSQPAQRRASPIATRSDPSGSLSRSAVTTTAHGNQGGVSSSTVRPLMTQPAGQPLHSSQPIPRSTSPRGVADLYRRGGASFGPAGGPASSSKRSRGVPSQTTAPSDAQAQSGSRARSRDQTRRQALGISSSEIAGSRAIASSRSNSQHMQGSAGRYDGGSQPEVGYRRSSGTRRSGSREDRDRSEAGPSEPRLASISINRRSVEGGLKPQQELSPRSHARQVRGIWYYCCTLGCPSRPV